MAEDSGAFKTNPAKSLQIRHFVITGRTVATKPHQGGKRLPDPPTGIIPPNCNKRSGEPCGIVEPA
jgi:hypothetical protein